MECVVLATFYRRSSAFIGGQDPVLILGVELRKPYSAADKRR
jgi:hypothetical protein